MSGSRRVYQLRGIVPTDDGVRVTFDIGPTRIVSHTLHLSWAHAANLVRQLKRQARLVREAAQAVEES